ncbi:MAG: DUF4007 family protein, partial [Caldilineaceae bacterium]|nr:DUF4007 family protein [Caldilineaceae bacterium]MCZ2153999.1 DUF4007 family protein [Bryobacterales bacterium]
MTPSAISKGYIPHFSGHETFPLRQMWLKKAFDCLQADWTVPKSIFTDESAIAKFGVGKNMVASIRHWALACDVLREAPSNAYLVSPLARAIFSDDGLDPYSEHSTTSWLVHWWLAGKGNRATTWYWLFNHVTAPTFSRDDLEAPLTEFARRLDPKHRLSISTLSRDIETCLRSYAPPGSGSPEDYSEPVLGELGLLHEERKGQFSFRRGPKSTLHDALFAYALIDFWDASAPTISSLAFETIAYGDGSPGRVFKLDEDSVAERLFALEEITGGRLSWTDTAGLRQVMRKEPSSEAQVLRLIEKAYG